MAETLAAALDLIFPADGSAPPVSRPLEETRTTAPAAPLGGAGSAPGSADVTTDGASPTSPGGSSGTRQAAAPQPAINTPGQAPDMRSLVQQAESYYRAAMTAQRAGDWAAYGEQIRLLGRTLSDLRMADQRQAPTPAPTQAPRPARPSSPNSASLGT